VIRLAALILTVGLASPMHAASPAGADEKVDTWTGWFSDLSCAAPYVARGEIAPNNPGCVKKCLDKGVPPVFVSEQAKALFEVKDYPSVKEDVGYHVEVTGVVDRAARAISIRSVKRLSYTGALCALPKKPKG
jgi:hypothetical protein